MDVDDLPKGMQDDIAGYKYRATCRKVLDGMSGEELVKHLARWRLPPQWAKAIDEDLKSMIDKELGD
jgi:hypothetical protein